MEANVTTAEVRRVERLFPASFEPLELRMVRALVAMYQARQESLRKAVDWHKSHTKGFCEECGVAVTRGSRFCVLHRNRAMAEAGRVKPI
jgi:hypothetical protein